jgi:hypothetical protein
VASDGPRAAEMQWHEQERARKAYARVLQSMIAYSTCATCTILKLAHVTPPSAGAGPGTNAARASVFAAQRPTLVDRSPLEGWLLAAGVATWRHARSPPALGRVNCAPR